MRETLRIYLASAFSKQAQTRQLAKELEMLGLHITSKWLYQTKSDHAASEKFLREVAERDLEDMRRADIFVRISDPEYSRSEPVNPKLLSGARMWESGYAFSLGKTVIVVNGPQCIFDRLPGVIHLKDAQELKSWVSAQILQRNLEGFLPECPPLELTSVLPNSIQ